MVVALVGQRTVVRSSKSSRGNGGRSRSGGVVERQGSGLSEGAGKVGRCG